MRCICSRGSDGPDESCPVHGRPCEWPSCPCDRPCPALAHERPDQWVARVESRLYAEGRLPVRPPGVTPPSTSSIMSGVATSVAILLVALALTLALNHYLR